MDQESQNRLEEILGRESASWSGTDKDFVCARRDYLNDEQKEVHKDFLKTCGKKAPAKKAD